MDLLPFLREASEYSALITVALYGLLSLQFKFMASGLRAEMEKRTRELEKSEDARHGRIDLALEKIQTAIHNDLHSMQLDLTKELSKLGQRVSLLEGRNNHV